MIAIAFITFRESIEMLLVGGVIYSALIEHKIHKKKELILGAFTGLIFSLLLFILVSFAGSRVHFKVDHELGEILEGANYIGSGIFLFFTAILLHDRLKKITSLSPSLLLNSSIFVVGFLMILREGIEIVFFSISPSLSTSFFSSFAGFILGIGLTVVLGIIGTRFAQARLSHRVLLLVSDWGIKLLSLYFVIKGVVGLAEFII